MSTKDLNNETFAILKEEIGNATLKALKKMGLKIMTNIQNASLKRSLEGCDMVASAKTGSGKTLAFLIPLIAVVRKELDKNNNGTYFFVLFFIFM